MKLATLLAFALVASVSFANDGAAPAPTAADPHAAAAAPAAPAAKKTAKTAKTKKTEKTTTEHTTETK